MGSDVVAGGPATLFRIHGRSGRSSIVTLASRESGPDTQPTDVLAAPSSDQSVVSVDGGSHATAASTASPGSPTRVSVSWIDGSGMTRVLSGEGLDVSALTGLASGLAHAALGTLPGTDPVGTVSAATNWAIGSDPSGPAPVGSVRSAWRANANRWITRLRLADDPAVIEAAAPGEARTGIAGTCADIKCSTGSAIGATKDGKTDIVNWSGLTATEATALLDTVTEA